MSLNDTKEVRPIFKGFRIQSVTTKYSAQDGKEGGARAKVHRELLIRNY